MAQKMQGSRCVLVLVDYQSRLLPAIAQGARVIAEAAMLADAARALGVRVVGTEQNPAGLGPNAPEVRQRCDTTLAKMHFDACEDGLAEALIEGRQGANPPEVVIAGCEAHVCLMQTALGLLARRFRVWVVESACASRRAADKLAAMQRLQQSGATLVTAEMVVFEWLGSCEHPAFKPVLQLVKNHDRP
jgi:nicotinamidase-related amidase